MPYGIEPESFEYVTDGQGRRTKALVPVSTLNALVEFWCAARRAHSDALEARTTPGLRPAPLRIMTGPSEAGPPPASSHPPAHPLAHDQHWQQLVAKLPEPTSPAPFTHTAAEPPKPLPAKPRARQTFYPREFTEPIPADVAQLIAAGVYFLKAWRTYRKLTLQDVADLLGGTRDGAGYHEYGYGKPTRRTLKAFAEVFDCSLGQLTVKPDTSTAPWLQVIEAPAGSEAHEEPRASEDTDYPEQVLAHLVDGKAPLTAWRLYRKLTLAQLGDAYGTSSFNVKRMESRALTRRTREKFAAVLRCTPEQLLRPEGLEYRTQATGQHETPASRRMVSAMLAAGS